MADHDSSLHPTPAQSKSNKMPLSVFFKDARHVFKVDSLGKEILQIALPAAMALAADPIASLIDTAFIGRIGAVELAAVGVSIAIFNQASKITIFPLVSITTSFVAQEETANKITADQNQDQKSPTKYDDGSSKQLAMAPPHHNHNHHQDRDPEEGLGSNCAPQKSNEKLNDDDSLPNNTTNALEMMNATCEVLAKKSTSVIASTNSSAGNNNSVRSKKKNKLTNKKPLGKRHIPSASTALALGAVLGLAQTIFLFFGANTLLRLMGIKQDSPMLAPAHRYLTLRSLGAPAVLLSLAMQGIFRGFKDTKTPLYATVAADGANIILDPILMFACHLGVSGAAIAHVISQYLMSFILLWKLMQQVDLLPPSAKDLQLSRFLKNGLYLLARVIAVTFCVTLAASMAARLGPTPMAAFQICLQVWMTSSLLADGLAVAGQAILASAFAEKNYDKATATASRVLQMSFVLGLGLAVFVGVGLFFGDTIFTKDVKVLHLISIGVPFVAGTQPINSVSFVFDGVNFGASDFAYSAYSMVVVATGSIASIFLLSKTGGFVGIWIALTIYTALRMFAGIWRMGTGTGPWHFLRSG